MNMEQKQFDSGILILMNIRIEKLNEVIINLKNIIEKRYYHPRFLIAGRYTNSDIDALLQKLGFSRVVLGREASLAKLREKYDLENRTLVRMKDEGFVEGQVRITPR